MATKTIAPKKVAKKTATKKAAPKKTAAKKPKVTTKEAPKRKKAALKNPPFEQFEGHSVTISKNRPDEIRFGCGAVTCNRKTLIRVAKFLENKEFAAILKTAQTLPSFNIQSLMAATPDQRKQIINILTHEGFSVGYQSLSDLYKETNGRKSINQLIALGAPVFRRLAATTRVGC